MKANFLLHLSCLIALFSSPNLFGQAIAPSAGGISSNQVVTGATSGPSVRLFMEDGQLHSHPVRIFVTANILEGMEPKLKLMTSHAILNPEPGEEQSLIPTVIAPNQQEVHEIEGTKVQLTGTTLIFDLKNWPIHAIKPMTRVEPLLEWLEKPGDQSTRHRAIGKTVYLGNQLIAGIYAILGVGLLLGVVMRLAWSLKSGTMHILCGPDGRLSLWRVQAACWTVAISSMVLMYGLIRKEVPGIPETLVILMGMSALTAGISHWQGTRSSTDSIDSPTPQGENQPSSSGPGVTFSSPGGRPTGVDPLVAAPQAVLHQSTVAEMVPPSVGQVRDPMPAALSGNPPLANGSKSEKREKAVTSYRFSDLICEEDANGQMQPSIPRAQLLFWTGITLSLFMAKTILEGALWNVPAQLVLLMGISQASYLGPKFFDSNKK